MALGSEIVRSHVRVVVPYVPGMLHEATVSAVRESDLGYSLVPLHQSDDGAYARLLRALWSSKWDLIIVEHDIVPTVTQLRRLASCDHRWCGYSYNLGGQRSSMALGCTRLSAQMRRCWPTLGTEISTIHDDRPHPCPWRSLDSRAALILRSVGESWWEHPGWVLHKGLAPTPAVR